MAVWAYRCKPCTDNDKEWFVAQTAVEEMPRGTKIVKVRVGDDWICAVVDRSHREQVEGLLVRDVIPATPGECPLYAEMHGEPEAAPAQVAASSTVAAPRARPAGRAPLKVQAAAISIRNAHVIVVAASMGLVTSPGEAHMAADDLRTRFGGTAIVLMAQDDAGAPVYYGDSVLVQMLEGIPLEKMPWKEYDLP